MANRAQQPVKQDAQPNPSVAAHQAVYAELLALVGAGHTRQGFIRRALEIIGRLFAAPYACLFWRDGADVLSEEHHSGATSPTFWRATVRDFVTDAMARGSSRARLLSDRQSELRIALIASPLYDSQATVCGALGIVVHGDEAAAAHHLTTLEALAAFTSHLSLAIRPPPSAPAPASAGSAAPHQALAKAAHFGTPTELAFSLTNSLRVKFGLEQVALAVVAGHSLRILSISGFDDFNPRSPGIVGIRSAMEECLDLGQLLVAQNDGAGTETLSTGHALHRRWHQAARGAAVASLPLRTGERVAAILSLRHVSGQVFSRETLEKIGAAAEPFVAAMEMLQRAQRSVLVHVRDAGRDAVRELLAPRRWTRKLALAAGLGALSWFLFGSLAHEVAVTCVVAPAQVRHLAMPYPGVLASANVLAGDSVRAGQVLAQLDRRSLDLQAAALLAEVNALEQERVRAAAAATPAEAQLATARQQLAQARLALVENQIEQSIIRAPFDGLVIAGDLRPLVGSLLPQGAPLVEVAPERAWQLQLEVPEASADDVRAGAPVRFALESRPEQVFAARLSHLKPSAELRRRQNVFVAEADFELPAAWLRPGMEGLARISAGRRAVWWVWFHQVDDYMRLHYWL